MGLVFRNAFLAAAIALCITAHAQQPQTIGDWTLRGGQSWTEAFTANDSGSSFGLYCKGDACSFYLDANIECGTDGAKVPMLVNAESGSTYVMTTCVNITINSSTQHVAMFRDKDIVTSISSGTAIGFAIAMQGGQFRVVRFSLNGAAAATNDAVSAAANLPKQTQQSQFRDTTM